MNCKEEVIEVASTEIAIVAMSNCFLRMVQNDSRVDRSRPGHSSYSSATESCENYFFNGSSLKSSCFALSALTTTFSNTSMRSSSDFIAFLIITVEGTFINESNSS